MTPLFLDLFEILAATMVGGALISAIRADIDA
jgi:hypothetical protein